MLVLTKTPTVVSYYHYPELRVHWLGGVTLVCVVYLDYYLEWSLEVDHMAWLLLN